MDKGAARKLLDQIAPGSKLKEAGNGTIIVNFKDLTPEAREDIKRLGGH